MDVAELFVTLGGIALIGFIVWFFFGGRDDESARETAVVGGASAGAVIYSCPMHPWITSRDPAANCSLCGMKLVKRD